MSNLMSWRRVIQPRKDVLQGELTLSKFAADLGDAALGRASEEYTNPSEFFAMTHLTEGLKRLLTDALRRVSGKGGDPVIQIKTAFGGGKTHSMLALYHMLKDSWPLDEVLDMSGVRAVPRVRVAVLAFNHKNPVKPEYVSGIRTYTLCGAMAAQLGGYEYVRQNDEAGVSPGKDDLLRMFDELGPCVILMDELVAYGRKIRGAEGLPEEGSYENFLTFLQELTEAAGMSRNSLVVATLPESETEAGGVGGVAVLREVEHIFGRIESVWKPVTADEGFEIVKKRLFKDCADPQARIETAEEFFRMYRSNPNDFPARTREVSYRERLLRCYPVHPEVFDRLYEDWSTLELFQRTRGVLRLMARVVRELWNNFTGDDALIMPGSLPLYRSDVLEELTRSLPSHDVWNGIVASDMEGENSASLREDVMNDRFTPLSACRRVSRAVMLGSAPLQGGKSVRGIERPGVLLGTVRPGDNIAAFNEALNTMKGALSYLYTDTSGTRYWFDTMPNLQKTARNKAESIEDYRVDAEVRRRLVTLTRNDGHVFAGVHVWPESSQSVPDDVQGVRLVVLEAGAGEDVMREFLLWHGNNKRAHLNTIVFLGADIDRLADLRRKVRIYLAWKDIDADAENMNLGARQAREVKENISRCNAEADSVVRSAWSCVYAPHTDYGGRTDAVIWEKAGLSGGEGIISSVKSCLSAKDWVVFRENGFAPQQLLNVLNNYNLWRGHDELVVRDLWNDFCSYCYLQRIASYDVLESAVARGADEGKFAFSDGHLVKNEAALKHENVNAVEEEAKPVKKVAAEATKDKPAERERERRGTRFHMHTDLEFSRLLKDVTTIQRDVLDLLEGAGKFRIRIDVNFYAPDGIDRAIQNDVKFNCKSMGIADPVFEEE